MPLSDKHLKTAEERLARLSVLQELTVAALDLFDPRSSADPFLERVAERLGCLAAVWVAREPERVRLVGAAGLSEASRALPIVPPRSEQTDPSALVFAYPELARPDLQRWSFRLEAQGAGGADAARASHALLLWFDAERKAPEEHLPAVERLVGVLVTVLSHRRLAQDLRHSYEELARTQLALVERERLAAIGELAAVVAHEVRNPLAVIFNCIGTLQKRGPSDEKELLRILREEANRLNQIVSELLEFARPGDVVLRSESIEEIVAGAIAAVKGAHTTVMRIDLEAPEPLPAQMLDARLVRRALINLLTNAVQAMPPEGRVVVRVVQEAFDGRPGVRIDVADDGPGIPPTTMTRIFEPFFTTKASGTGLGLSIVKHNVEAHHGEVTVRSEEGRGTTFVIRLPSSPE